LLKILISTICAKVVMALTGLVIVGFLFGHALGNLQYFLGPDAYNTYAAALQGLGAGLLAIRGFLIVCIVLHIISAVYLRLYNNAAKPTHYKVKKYVKSKLTARTMLWTGVMICIGVTLHLLHFTTGTIQMNDGYNNYEIVPTGHFAVDCNTFFNDCETDCNTVCATACSEEFLYPCQVPSAKTMTFNVEIIDGERFVVLGDQKFSINEHLQRTGQVWEDVKIEEVVCAILQANTSATVAKSGCTDCAENCPAGDEMCATCEANPSQCSKFRGTFVAGKSDDCKDAMNCAPTKSNCMAVVKERHDVHAMVTAEFSSIGVALLYLLFVLLVCFHLNHAIQSAFHTLGIEGPKFTPIMRILSILLSVALLGLFAILPIAVVIGNLFGINLFCGGC